MQVSPSCTGNIKEVTPESAGQSATYNVAGETERRIMTRPRRGDREHDKPLITAGVRATKVLSYECCHSQLRRTVETSCGNTQRPDRGRLRASHI
jgi:hypothetical protein